MSDKIDVPTMSGENPPRRERKDLRYPRQQRLDDEYNDQMTCDEALAREKAREREDGVPKLYTGPMFTKGVPI